MGLLNIMKLIDTRPTYGTAKPPRGPKYSRIPTQGNDMGEFPNKATQFTPENARDMQKRSAAAQEEARKTLTQVTAELGELYTVADAQRWLTWVALHGAAGELPGTVVNGVVRALEVWLRAHSEGAAEQVKGDLERKIRKLERESRKRRVA